MVLLVSYSGAFGGAERLLVQFSAAFSDRCCLACPEGGLAVAARAAGIPVLRLSARPLTLRGGVRTPAAAVARLVAHGAEVRRLVRALRPNVVIAWGMRSAIACLSGPRLDAPVVFQHNDLLPGPAVGALVRRAARRAALTIALSQTIAGEVPGAVTVYPGVPVADAGCGRPPEAPPEVLLLGAITAWKRPDLAFEACALARRRHPALRLRVAGEPLDDAGAALLERLRERAARPDLAGAVEFAGRVPDSGAALARAACLLHCAEQEPFGMAVLEALAAGRPAIVPASAGPAEIVVPSCGRLYPPGDAAAAARAVCEVVADRGLAAALGRAGRVRARTRFGLSRARSEYAAAVDAAARPDAPVRVEPGTLAVVTVTRNSGAHLAALLASTARYLPDVRVIVVDCASADDTLAVARAADLIALDENVGFGRGCNLGVSAVREPVVALVNPDVELVDSSLLELAGEALRAERLLAPLVLTSDGSRQDSVHPAPLSPADLVRAVVPPALVPGRLGLPLAPWRADRPRRVGWAVGCAVVAQTATLRRLGPFDERFFLYGEDLDLGLRAAHAGVETWFRPEARLVHHRAHASAREFGGEPFDRLARARYEAVAGSLGPQRAALDAAGQAVTFASRGLLKRAAGRPSSRERRQLAAVVAVARSGASQRMVSSQPAARATRITTGCRRNEFHPGDVDVKAR